MVRVIYYDWYKEWDRNLALDLLKAKAHRLGEDVRYEPGGLEEKKLAESPYFSYHYAKILKDRFVLGEPAIARDASSSYYYARDVIKGRFEPGESAIAKHSNWSYNYASDVIGGRFPAGERAMIEAAYVNKLDRESFDKYLTLLVFKDDPYYVVLARIEKAYESLVDSVFGDKELTNFALRVI